MGLRLVGTLRGGEPGRAHEDEHDDEDKERGQRGGHGGKWQSDVRTPRLRSTVGQLWALRDESAGILLHSGELELGRQLLLPPIALYITPMSS